MKSRPSFAGFYSADGALMHVEGFGYIGVLSCGFANFKDFLIGKFSIWLKATPLDGISRIVGKRTDFKMIGVHANPVVAFMPNDKAIGNRTVVDLVRDAVRASYLRPNRNNAISFLIFCPRPMPAATFGYFNELPKSFCDWNFARACFGFGRKFMQIALNVSVVIVRSAKPASNYRLITKQTSHDPLQSNSGFSYMPLKG